MSTKTCKKMKNSIFVIVLLCNSIFLNLSAQGSLEWKTVFYQPGITWYNYEGFIEQQNAFQIINVLEIDISSEGAHSVSVVNVNPRDSLSSVAARYGAVVGINGTYESDASYVKSNDSVHAWVTLDNNHLRSWKHEGALFIDNNTGNYKIEFGSRDTYKKSGFPNIISGAPMLIDNYQPVGSFFIGDVSNINLDSLEYEDYRRHQGVRHPRTAVGLTSDNKLLLITVDGRREGVSEGMSAKELTELLQQNFNPKSALNIDGGGSTTMWIAGYPHNGVVNYPTDNRQYDHLGQRRVRSFILVKSKCLNEN